MTAVASHLAAQHLKTRNVILFMWKREVSPRNPCLSDSVFPSHQPAPHPSSSTSPSQSPAPPPALGHSWRFALYTRTSARAQINFNLLIPFEKKWCAEGRGEGEEGELKKRARSLFEFLIAGAQNVTYRCEIPTLDEILTRS